MTGRQRLRAVYSGQVPDRVPVVPDIYEMISVKLLGKPSWDTLLFADPPIWKARADACEYFGADVFFPLYVPMEDDRKIAIVSRSDKQIITRGFSQENGEIVWASDAMIYYKNDPSAFIQAAPFGLPDSHDEYEVVEPKYNKFGKEYFDDAKEYVGEKGVVAPMVFLPCLGSWESEILRYYDERDKVKEEINASGEFMMKRAKEILSWNPDVLLIGNSGLMIFNPEPIFRDLCLKWHKKVTKLAKDCGVPTHIHCCGPENKLVEISALESDLVAIEPLEVAPMGDCDLAQIKKLYGDRLVLKGNLHTTENLLNGSVDDVVAASKKAIDDAGAGGGFILSSGDQVGRDTPFENIFAMVETAKTYGRYDE